MSAKRIMFDQDAREAIRRGVKQLARAVKVTLGPRGRAVLLEKKWGAPIVSVDGVAVAKEIELKDPYENMGAQMVKEVASKTNDVAGDGTTSATVLAEAIFEEGLKNVTAGANPIALKRGIDKAVETIVAELKRLSKPVRLDDVSEVRNVGTIAAGGDESIGKMLAEAMQKVGKDGVITVEEGKGLETYVEWVEGMQFDKGYLSPYFVTEPEAMKATFKDCYILLHEKKISAVKDLIPLLETIAKTGKPLLIISEDIEGDALSTLVVNKLRVEDGLHASRAAVEEGSLPGGGVARLRASRALDKIKGSDDDEKTGIDSGRRAVEAPLQQISRNSGVEGAIVVSKVLESKD